MNDNITAQNLAHGEMTLNRMKHIDALSKHSGIRYHWIRELILAGLIELKHVSSENNQSDLFTKPLSRIIHERLRGKVMNIQLNEKDKQSIMEAAVCFEPERTSTVEERLIALMIEIGA